MIQTKGKLSLSFRAELTEEFLGRVEKVKEHYVSESYEKIEQLLFSVEQKKAIVLQGISCLSFMRFDDEQGLVLDQLQMMLENSFTDGNMSINQSKALAYAIENDYSARNSLQKGNLNHHKASKNGSPRKHDPYTL